MPYQPVRYVSGVQAVYNRLLTRIYILCSSAIKAACGSGPVSYICPVSCPTKPWRYRHPPIDSEEDTFDLDQLNQAEAKVRPGLEKPEGLVAELVQTQDSRLSHSRAGPYRGAQRKSSKRLWG